MKKLDLFWMSKKEWRYVDKDGNLSVDKNAPPEAQKSYKHYLEQKKETTAPTK